MRIFYSLLLMVSAVVLFFLPVTAAIYDFRTDVKEDKIIASTGVGEATANVTLFKTIYNADTSTLSIYSNNSTDTPLFSAYNAATKTLLISGLTANTTRTLTISYDYDVLAASTALSNFLDKLSWIWMVCVIGFVPAALVAIFVPRA